MQRNLIQLNGKYNITSVDKQYLLELYSQHPMWYALTHSFGERILNPVILSNGDMDNALSIATSASYIWRDFKKFTLILDEAGSVVEYLDLHPECVTIVAPPEVKQKYPEAITPCQSSLKMQCK